MRRRLPRRTASLWAVVVFGALTASIAYASIPDGAGVIHGCYSKISGALRVIDTAKGQKCSGTELALTWSQTGPKGTTGARGPTGKTGSIGPKGTTGAVGATGPRGPSGTSGTRGPTGVQGTAGETGPRGPSDAYVFYKQSADIGPVSYPNSEGFVAGQLDLPAGSYVIDGRFTPSLNNSEIDAYCYLEPAGTYGSASGPENDYVRFDVTKTESHSHSKHSRHSPSPVPSRFTAPCHQEERTSVCS